MVAAIIATLSPARFSTYLTAMNHDPDGALQLYLWNAKIGETFHMPIQATEIALRNRINHTLVAKFGSDWWSEPKFLALLDRERLSDIDTVKRRIINRKLSLVTDQIVAGLSFGFWTGMLQPKFNPQIWSSHLRATFPHLPTSESRDSLAKRAGKAAFLRNRIWHHEPVFKSDLSLAFSEIMSLVQWLCPETHAWIRPHCRVPELLRQKPKPKSKR